MSLLVDTIRSLRLKNVVVSLLAGLLVSGVLVGCVAISRFLDQGEVWEQVRAGKFSWATFYYERGNYFFGGAAYDLDASLRNYERALHFTNVDNVPILYQLGRLYFIKGDLPKAIVTFNQQLEADPSFMRTYYMRGLTYGYQGHYARAAEDFKKFLQWRPGSWAAHNDLVWIYFLAGDFEQAETYARAGLAYNPQNPWLSNALGAILLNQGKYDEANQFLGDAKKGFAAMTEEMWGQAYPGNHPLIYAQGLAATRQSVADNLALVERALAR